MIVSVRIVDILISIVMLHYCSVIPVLVLCSVLDEVFIPCAFLAKHRSQLTRGGKRKPELDYCAMLNHVERG